MVANLVEGLLWISAIGCGLMAGVYFAFSAFIMTALGGIAPAAGISAMNAINRLIVRSPFMPLFLATTLASAALVVLGALGLSGFRAIALITGGAIYVVGMFGVTAVCNVPLNNALADIDGTGGGDVAHWQRYCRQWTLWNHVRAAASTVSSVLFTAAIGMAQL